MQSENVEYSNLRMFLPRVMDFKLLQHQNEYPSIYSISLLTVTDVSFVQLSNAEYPKYLILLDISYVNICNPAGKRIKVVSFCQKNALYGFTIGIIGSNIYCLQIYATIESSGTNGFYIAWNIY